MRRWRATCAAAELTSVSGRRFTARTHYGEGTCWTTRPWTPPTEGEGQQGGGSAGASAGRCSRRSNAARRPGDRSSRARPLSREGSDLHDGSDPAGRRGSALARIRAGLGASPCAHGDQAAFPVIDWPRRARCCWPWPLQAWCASRASSCAVFLSAIASRHRRLVVPRWCRAVIALFGGAGAGGPGHAGLVDIGTAGDGPFVASTSNHSSTHSPGISSTTRTTSPRLVRRIKTTCAVDSSAQPHKASPSSCGGRPAPGAGLHSMNRRASTSTMVHVGPALEQPEDGRARCAGSGSTTARWLAIRLIPSLVLHVRATHE